MRTSSPALRSRRAQTVVVLLAFVTVLAAAVGVASPAAAESPVTVQARAAAAYGASHHLRTGIAVLDLRTGAYYGAGDDTGLFGTASVVKVMIAARLLATGQMTGSTASLAYDMIVRSNDDAASALWPQEGGPDLINWVKAYFHLPFLGTPNIRAYHWGNTHVSPRGLVYLYRAIKNDRRVGPWLLNAMHHYQCRAWDGTDQCFGLPSVTTGAAIKQGWAAHSADRYDDAIVNSTGFVDGDRYAVAIMSEGHGNNNTTNWTGYNAAQARIVSAQARLLLPAGLVDDPVRHNPTVDLESVRAVGNTVTVSGWAFDPDRPARRSVVSVTSGRSLLGGGQTTVYRPGVNRTYRLTGDHGFVLHVVARNGWRTVCVTVANAGEGTARARVCRGLGIDGTARGGFDSATVAAGKAVLAGWTSDPDAGMRSTSVQIREAGKVVGTYRADRYSAVVNSRHHLTGNHAYLVGLAGADGRHTYCAFAVNTGPAVSAAYVPLGCRSVTLANDPLGAVEDVSPGSAGITVTGWAYDPNVPAASTSVQITIDAVVHQVVADQARADVDADHHITGDHGFTADFAATPGQHVVTVTLLNTGPGASVSLGSTTVTVPTPAP